MKKFVIVALVIAFVIGSCLISFANGVKRCQFCGEKNCVFDCAESQEIGNTLF